VPAGVVRDTSLGGWKMEKNVFLCTVFVVLTVSASAQSKVPDAFVRINGGTFMMGSPANEPEREDDEVQHQVTVSAFYMGKYEVTQGQYEAIMGNNPSTFQDTNIWDGRESHKNKDQRPVEGVSWYGILVFCNKLSMKDGLTPAYSINGKTDPAEWGEVPKESSFTWNAVRWNKNANGYRLPTEAEWEYACRAGSTTAYSLGDTWNTDFGTVREVDESGGGPSIEWLLYVDGTTDEVGSSSPNAWGLYDMHGNVWELCWDWYDDYSSEVKSNPVGSASGTERVIRGGSWYYHQFGARSAFRGSAPPFHTSDSIGFRLARY
jgi:formylglycine-generating enzyme required for sulfatase activity